MRVRTSRAIGAAIRSRRHELKLDQDRLAVSRAIKEVEAHIGVQLFVRGTRGVRLTAAARTHASDVAPALRQIALACARVRLSRPSE